MSKHAALPDRLRHTLESLSHSQRKEALRCLGVPSLEAYFDSAAQLFAAPGRGARESLTDTQHIPAVTA